MPKQSWVQSLSKLSSHVPHWSNLLFPFGTPAQSAHDELSPAQIPHSSSTEVPPQIPKQSWIQSLLGLSSQLPHWSKALVPFGMPAQSAQVELSPSQIPHWSTSATPPQTPLQSCVQLISVSVTHVPHSS